MAKTTAYEARLQNVSISERGTYVGGRNRIVQTKEGMPEAP